MTSTCHLHEPETSVQPVPVTFRKDAAPRWGAPRRSERSGARHGLVLDAADALAVVVEDAGASDLRALARDLATRRSAAKPAAGAAHLSVRFVDELSPDGLHLIDAGRVGYGADGIYLLEPASGRPLARVSQGTRWGAGRVECARGLRRVPLLSAAVDLAALSGGWAPLHAAAWTTREGVRVLASGWPGSGKTGALLAACEEGATPLADDRVLLFRDGQALEGLGRPVEIKDWHVAQLRLTSLGASRRRKALARATHALDGALLRRRPRWSRTARKVLRRVRRLASTELDIAELGAPGDGRGGGPHVLILLEGHSRDAVVAEPADPGSLPERLTAHVAAELEPTLRMQRALDYVTPGEGWRAVHRAPEVALGILERAVRGIPAWIVRHPYPCSLRDLHAAISRLVAETAS